MMEFNRYTSSANILFISDPEGPKFQRSGACIVPSEIYRKTPIKMTMYSYVYIPLKTNMFRYVGKLVAS